MRALARVAALALALSLVPTTARAEVDLRVVLVRRGLPDAVATRIAAELGDLGFEVQSTTDDPGEDLARVSRLRGAAAVIRAAPDAGALDLWIMNQASGRITQIRLPAEPSSDGATALRAVEQVRASLLEVRRRRRPRPPDPPRPPSSPPPSPPSQHAKPHLGAIEIAPALLVSPGGLSPAPAVILAARWMPAGFVSAGALLLAPLTPSRVSTPGGVVALRPMLLGAGLRLSPGPIGLWSPSVEVGGAALWVHGSATAARGYRATSVDRAIGAAYLRAGVALALSARFAVRADVLGGAALPEARVAVDGREVARWGEPFIAPSLGMELGW